MTDREVAQAELTEMKASLEELVDKLPTLEVNASHELLSLARFCVGECTFPLSKDGVATYDLKVAFERADAECGLYNDALDDIKSKTANIAELERELAHDELWREQ